MEQKNIEKNKKTACNNQWAGTATGGNSSDYKDKTEFSNEWVSTNKMASANQPPTSENQNEH